MGASYTEEEKKEKFDLIIRDIEVLGKSLRQSLEGLLSSETFYKWISEDEELSKRYARACENRQDALFDEILEIADNDNPDLSIVDGNVVVDGQAVQRSKLRIDARKWMLAKMNPKKYGERVDVNHGGQEGNPVKYINLGGGEPTED